MLALSKTQLEEMLSFPKPLLRIYWSEVTLIFLSLFQSAKSWAWAVIFLEHGRGPLPQGQRCPPPTSVLSDSLPGEHRQKQEQCEFLQKEFIPKQACLLENKFVWGKENTIVTFAQNEELWAGTDWSGGRVEKGQGTSDEGRGSKKRKTTLIPPKEACTQDTLVIIISSTVGLASKCLDSTSSLKRPRFSTTWDRDGWEARAPHRWFLSNWAARVKKGFRVLHWHLFPFQVPFFITAGIWGGILIPMSKS